MFSQYKNKTHAHYRKIRQTKKLYRTLPDFGVDEEFLNRMQEGKKKLTIKSDKVKNIKN